MKLHILSDLHTEFADFSPPATDANAVILAGDVGVGLGGLEWATALFRHTQVIYIPGNHEYYGHAIELDDDLVKASTANVHMLNNDTVVLNGVRFLGSTLWTDFQLYGEGEAWRSRQRARRWLSDFNTIKYRGLTFTPEDSVVLHESSKAWLDSELGIFFDGPTVVVTHHLPSELSVAAQFAGDSLNPAFASNVEYLFEKHGPELWIHGHTHVACDYEIYGTRVVCNPRGYPGESSARGFRPGLVVEI